MPWKVSDVDSHIKGLSTKQKNVWVAAANNALRLCESKGEKDCDARAIRIANAAAKRIKESYLSPSFITSNLPENSEIIESIEKQSPSKFPNPHLTHFGLLQLQSQYEYNLAEALSMLAQDEAFDARRMAVSNAVRTWAQLHSLTNASDYDMYRHYDYAYVVDLYSDVVIFSWRNMLWRADYSIDGENKATLGDPARVKLYYAPLGASDATTTDEPAEGYREIEDPARLFAPFDELNEEIIESKQIQEEMLVESDCIPLEEAAVKDGKAKVCVISPGWGSSGYYSADVLKRDGPNVFPKGTHMHWDHPTVKEAKERPEGSLDKLAGVLESNASWDDDGFNGPGLYADVKVFEGKVGVLNEIAPYIGTSVKTPGMVKEGEAEGKKGKIVESLLYAKNNAVDFVTIPGRGGAVYDLVESARERLSDKPEIKEDDDMDKAQIDALVKEAVTAALAEATKDADKKIVELTATVERQRDALLLRDAREAATAEVVKYNKLGDRAKQRVVSLAIAGEVPLTESGVLDIEKINTLVKENADAELEYLKSELARTPSNGRAKVTGLGESDSSETDDKVTPEQITESLEGAAKALGFTEAEAKTFAGINF